jgi:hypothetical protein
MTRYDMASPLFDELLPLFLRLSHDVPGGTSQLLQTVSLNQKCGCSVWGPQVKINLTCSQEMSLAFPLDFTITLFDLWIGRRRLEYRNRLRCGLRNEPPNAVAVFIWTLVL